MGNILNNLTGFQYLLWGYLREILAQIRTTWNSLMTDDSGVKTLSCPTSLNMQWLELFGS